MAIRLRLRPLLLSILAGLFGAGLLIFALPEASAQVPDVGPSGCVKYCDEGGSSSGNTYTGPNIIDQFFQGLAEQRRQNRLARMKKENNACIAFGNEGKWEEAELACGNALKACDQASDCQVIQGNLAWATTGADTLRAEAALKQQGAATARRASGNLGSLAAALQRDLALADTSVVDLTFLDPDQPIMVSPATVKGNPEPQPSNRKTERLLDALEAGKGEWAVSIDYLEAYLQVNPGDLAARDSLSYLLGMHKGYLARADWANLYVGRGIASWLWGQYDLAVADFGKAAVGNPDDVAAAQLLAFVMGERDGSGYCVTHECFATDPEYDPALQIHDIPAELDYLDDPRMDELRLQVKLNPDDLEARSLLNYIEGLSVYSQMEATKSTPLPAEADTLVDEALSRLAGNDLTGAAKALTAAHGLAPGNPGIMFSLYYSVGIESGRQQAPEPTGSLPWDQRAMEAIAKVILDIGAAEDEAFLFNFFHALGQDPRDVAQGLVNKKFSEQEMAYAKAYMQNPFYTAGAGQP